MAAFFIDPFPNGFFADVEGSADMADQIGNQQAVGLVSGAMLRRMEVADHFAALVGEHDDKRIGDPERARRRGFLLQHRPATLARARLLTPFCFAHISSYRRRRTTYGNTGSLLCRPLWSSAACRTRPDPGRYHPCCTGI